MNERFTNAKRQQSDLYDWMRAQNRRYWILAFCVVAACSVTLFVSIATIWRPIPVVVFDAQGQPILFQDTRTPGNSLTETRVSYFVKAFTRKWIGIDSGALERDFADALNMMTPKLRHLATETGTEAKRRATYANSNITTRFHDLVLKTEKFDPIKPTGAIHGYLWGKMSYRPKRGASADVQPVEKHFLSAFVATRKPVSEQYIHGLAMDYFEAHTFDTKSELDNHMLRRLDPVGGEG